MMGFTFLLTVFLLLLRIDQSIADSGRTNEKCDKYLDDFDIIRRFPFPLLINPDESIREESFVRTYQHDNRSIQQIQLVREVVVPVGVFCLKNLQDLLVYQTPFYRSLSLRTSNLTDTYSLFTTRHYS